MVAKRASAGRNAAYGLTMMPSCCRLSGPVQFGARREKKCVLGKILQRRRGFFFHGRVLLPSSETSIERDRPLHKHTVVTKTLAAAAVKSRRSRTLNGARGRFAFFPGFPASPAPSASPPGVRLINVARWGLRYPLNKSMCPFCWAPLRKLSASNLPWPCLRDGRTFDYSGLDQAEIVCDDVM
ncbi:hypothetical protein MRX96_029542 [Rhipicephalus microplus]